MTYRQGFLSGAIDGPQLDFIVAGIGIDPRQAGRLVQLRNGP